MILKEKQRPCAPVFLAGEYLPIWSCVPFSKCCRPVRVVACPFHRSDNSTVDTISIVGRQGKVVVGDLC